MSALKDHDLLSAEELKQEEQDEAERQLLENEVHAAWDFVLSSPQGRLVLTQILRFAGYHNNSAVRAAWRTNETFFNAGQQSVGEFITGLARDVSTPELPLLEQLLKEYFNVR